MRTVVAQDLSIKGTEQSTQQPGTVENPSLFLYPTQNKKLSDSVGMWARVTYSTKEYIDSKIQMDPPSTVAYSLLK